jgi:hypothetical protein
MDLETQRINRMTGRVKSKLAQHDLVVQFDPLVFKSPNSRSDDRIYGEEFRELKARKLGKNGEFVFSLIFRHDEVGHVGPDAFADRFCTAAIAALESLEPK